MFDPKRLHHAYFIEGEKESALSSLELFLKDSFGMIRQGNPDIHYLEYVSFGIDEGRILQEMSSVKPLMGDKKIFIIGLDSMTVESQNSLLKTFEEPTAHTHFFIISSSSRILLPTLASRLIIVKHTVQKTEDSVKNSLENEIKEEVTKFIKGTVKDRLEFVSKIIEEKDKAKAEDFLTNLLIELHGSGLETASRKHIRAVKEIVSLIPYLKDRSSSLKLILERVALIEI